MFDARALPDDLGFMAGGGEMGRLMRAHDWAASPLGPVSTWQQSLRTTISTCLECAFPILVWWGADLVMLYNDEYRQILGTTKHPRALGARGQDIFPELWDVIGPMLEQVMAEGKATRSRDLQLLMDRHGYEEETYFSFSYSPIRDETGGIGGVFTPVFETTERVIGERRLRTLRDLAAKKRPHSMDDACRAAMETLAENPSDIPFAVIYLVEDATSKVRFSHASGTTEGEAVAPSTLDATPEADANAGWPVAAAVHRGEVVVVDDIAGRFPRPPMGIWPDPPRKALILPITQPGHDRPIAVLIVAVSPRRALDEDHRAFFGLVAAQIGQIIAEALSYEEERKRAEALAEIDRAKTLFFSNVSHEFRTPVTLIIGPLEQIVDDYAVGLPPAVRELIDTSRRNAQRLLKLVNSLLDFSRIEAGRVQASFEPVDLAELTADLASNFRAATDRAGLSLRVDAPSLPRPVWVDRDMWEKIVLNLMSNAFKFTFEGGIEVKVSPTRDLHCAQVVIEDTGVGIPSTEIPNLFQRFHRIPATRGRSIEGSGIGLALVQELVKLHGGAVSVASDPGRGSRFTITLPFGPSHLPASQIGAVRSAPTGPSAPLFVEEALRWLPDGEDSADSSALWLESARPGRSDGAGHAPEVLVVDDNADMRDYIGRLLRDAGYRVEVASDGEAALATIGRRQPDLVLSDAMMPALDGFALLQCLRSMEATRAIPFIMVSARAGEDSRIEGLNAGVDDYIVKPFSAREVLAKVASAIRLANARREAANALHAESLKMRAMFDQAPGIIAILTGPDHVFEFANDSYKQLVGRRDLIGRKVNDAFPEIAGQGFIELLDQVYTTGQRFVGRQMPIVFQESQSTRAHTVYLDFIYEAVTNAAGEVTGIFVEGFDVSDRVRYEQHLRLLIDELNHRVKNTLAIIQGIAQQTFKGVTIPGDRRTAFEGRLAALAAAHSLLTRANWLSADLGEIVGETLRVHGPNASRYTVNGPLVELEPKTAVTIAMAFHELCTNAAKYGSLSTDGGTVDVNWRVHPGAQPELLIDWKESGGPSVNPPRRRGFGSRMIEGALADELQGVVSMDWRPTGLVCKIRAPLPPPPSPNPERTQ